MITELSLFYMFSLFAILSGIMVIRAKNPVYSVLFLILVFCNAAGLLILLDLDFFAMVFLVVYVGAIAVLFLFVVMMLNIRLAEINENVLRYVPVGGFIGIIFLLEVFLIMDQDIVPMLAFEQVASFSSGEMMTMSFLFFLMTLLAFLIFFLPNLFYFQNIFAKASDHYAHFQQQLNAMTHAQETYTFAQVDYIVWPEKIENITTIEALGQVVYTYYAYFFIIASLILLIAMIGAIVLTMHKGVQVKRQEVFDQNRRDFSKTVLKIKNV